MNELIQRYIDAVKHTRSAGIKEREAEEAADFAKLPKNLRPANAKDIVEGAVIWYPAWKTEENDPNGDDRCWNLVCEVLNPSDERKAYCSHDGSRYGLYGAHIEL